MVSQLVRTPGSTDAEAPLRLPAVRKRPLAGLGWLVAVAVAFALAQLWFVPPSTRLGWDEVVYVSQVGGHAPPAFFSAPRARGVTYLVAPVAALTSSTTALRVYLALLSGAGLFASLWVWRHLRPPRTLALAGLLFSGLWITVFYGPQAMPNLWVAFCALAAVGFFLRAVRAPEDRVAVLGLGGVLAAATLLRPPDAAWLAMPLLAAAACRRPWRHPRVLAAVTAGVVLGAVPWVVEAYTRFGGVTARLHHSSAVEGGMALHLAVGDQLRSLDGHALCRPCTVPWPDTSVIAWWLVLPLLVGGALAVAVRTGRGRGMTVLLTVCASTVAVPYLLLIDYAAPRFLLLSYALLALPVADFLTWAVTSAPRPGPRPLAGVGVAVLLAGHLSVQYAVLTHAVSRAETEHADYARLAARLHQRGVRPPCLVTGRQAIPVAYYTGCASANTAGNNKNTTPAGVRAVAAREPVAVLVSPRDHTPSYARAWPAHPLHGLHTMKGYQLRLPPR